MHILVVEDHADSRDALVWLLKAIGHRIQAAPDADNALRALSQFRFDVLLTDILMPEMSGLDLLHELRINGQLPPYLVTMSALDREEARPLSKEAGCHAHLAKPFSSAELVATLEGACAAIR